MSVQDLPTAHAPPAGDPHCRNCGAVTSGGYCAACGQETRVALPTARQFMREATGRVIAWDGRLWRTLYALAFRPGLLTKAYLAGRRRYYVRPARLFLGMSLILFAVIRFEIGTADTSKLVIVDSLDKATKPDTTDEDAERKQARERPGKASSSKEGADPARKAAKDMAAAHPGAGYASRSPVLSLDVDDNMNFLVDGSNSYLAGKLRERFNPFNKLSPEEKSERLLDGALRYGSYVLFALLPVFAALQMLSYVGRGRRYPGRPKLYAEHLVYAAHLHTFFFLVLIAVLVLPWQPARIALGAWVLYYIARSKKTVYGGALWGRVFRSLFVALLYTGAVSFGIAGLVLASILLR